ncbi:glycoside hydrolase family 31 protein [Telmatospirillum sp.]|uniref:glycoside hydrolase family 31 protein n=1 Tax=Telmatospirillum sp. TaxID=2079197 RepID=UPI00283B6631|nr:glycoside hydrolase family 31 protein [Telmatospirillum sp.]MDR3440993.1 glycoside hydrolase family 31 protein [Telmatospirillum sp.]
MSLSAPVVFSLAERTASHLTLGCPEGHVAHVFVLEEDIIRVMVLPGGTIRAPRTWAIAPGADDVPTDGRDRFDLAGFTCPTFSLEQTAERIVIATAQLRLTIALSGLFCQWETMVGGAWRVAASDRPTQNYNFGLWDDRVYHYLKRDPDEKYFGLGERAGTGNRAGQSYRMTNVDAMGYSARTTDPLYKHIPFYLTWKTTHKVPLGLFYDTLADCTFDMGRELDNYHGHYRYFVADHGDLDYYIIGGVTPADITRRFTWLTGRPAFMPKWSLGYSGSTMSYTDAPNAQVRMNEFLENCERHDILCDSFHLSSGYTSIANKRYVFNWNRDKFPDPKGFADHYLDHGVRLYANIKPCLLRDHPRFEEARRDGLFIHESDGSPAPVQFWDETGAYLDFTNPKTFAWWKARVTDALLQYDIAATWNDNNEFEVWSDHALIDGFGTPRPAREAKPLHTLLMLQASRQAQIEFAPDRRPFLISRSGAAGMQRYVQTWSGDNYTSWETLKYNIRMGNGLALSGVSNTGHDIGGFAGPAPEPELFLRWIQFGIFLPRFSIHSWNDDQTANEPWMFPELTPHIRELIKFRYRLIPYIYDLLWRSHSRYEPMIRPTFFDFPDDERCFEENDDMLLGSGLLVAAVVEPGARSRRVYLPSGSAWYDFWSGDHYQGGQEIVLPAPWDRPPLLARAGSVIPLNLAEQHFNRPADRRGFALFPDAGSFTTTVFDDDGDGLAYRDGNYGQWEITLSSSPTDLTIDIAAGGRCPPKDRQITVLLPRQDIRTVRLARGSVANDRQKDGWREIVVDL